MRGGWPGLLWAVCVVVIAGGCSLSLDYPSARERDRTACGHLRDDDGDGLVDQHEPGCWPLHQVTLGNVEEGAPERCASLRGSTVVLDDTSGDAFLWAGCDGTDCGAFDQDPADASASAAHLWGGASCSGSGVLDGECVRAVGREDITGGPCWTLSAELRLGPPGSAVALVLSPRLRGSAHPLRQATDPAVVEVARRAAPDGSARTVVAYTADGRRAELDLEAEGDLVRLTVTSSGLGSCGALAYGPLEVGVDVAGVTGTLSRWPERTSLSPPVGWKGDLAFRVGAQASGPGEAWIRGLRVERPQLDPCGYPVPQITSAEGGARPLAVARGGGRICVLGATAGPAETRLDYDPVHDFAWPPEASTAEADAELPSALGSWHVDDRGAASFEGLVEGPFPAATRPPVARAAALRWDEVTGRFEGVALLSDHAREGGVLARVTSEDCERWEVAEAPELEAAGAAFPIAYEAEGDTRRVLLATPAEGHPAVADPDPRCTTEREAGFFAPADPVPYVKAHRCECMPFPRGGLREATRTEGEEAFLLGDELEALPAFDFWRVNCGCLAGGSGLRLTPLRTAPTEVHQALSRGGTRVLVGTGELGVELVWDDAPGRGDDRGIGPADAVLLGAPLLEPSGAAGTFDALRVGDARLLVLEGGGVGCAEEALLFYRGFEDAVEGDGRTTWIGGGVGVVRVRFGEPGAEGCGDLGPPP